MKKYSTVVSIGILLCVIGIVLVLVNWFTKVINPTMTMGASAICLLGFIMALVVLLRRTKK